MAQDSKLLTDLTKYYYTIVLTTFLGQERRQNNCVLIFNKAIREIMHFHCKLLLWSFSLLYFIYILYNIIFLYYIFIYFTCFASCRLEQNDSSRISFNQKVIQNRKKMRRAVFCLRSVLIACTSLKNSVDNLLNSELYSIEFNYQSL